MHFRSADQTPEYVRIVADLATWANVFKIAATAFLAKIGSLAAEDLWKNKGRIAEALRDESAQSLRSVASALHRLKFRSPSTATVSLSIPIPDDFPGTNLTCPAASEEEFAVYLACFAMRVDAISAVVNAFMSKHASKHVSVHLVLLDGGAFKVTLTEYMRGIEHNSTV